MKIIALRIIDRIKESGLTQGVLSKYASVITTRLGFHEVTDAVCSREACIILHLKDDVPALSKELNSIGGVIIREVVFPDSAVKDSLEISIDDLDSPADVLVVLTIKKADVIGEVQEILTSYGCNIRTRLGISLDIPHGLIILELVGDDKQRLLLENDLNCTAGVEAKKVIF